MDCDDSVQAGVLVRGRGEAVRRYVPQTATVELHRLARAGCDDDIRDDPVAWELHLFDARTDHVGDVLRHLATALGFVLLSVKERPTDDISCHINFTSLHHIVFK